MKIITDGVRRANRGLVLNALRVGGPQPRTQLAVETGLSPASITAIVQDMIAQGILADLPEPRGDIRLRGRPAVRVGFGRGIATLCLVEIEVTRCRFSVVDYGGTLIDRIETRLTPDFFRDISPAVFLAERIGQLRQRNPLQFEALRRIVLSVQGVLERDATSLKWSPVPGLADAPLVRDLGAAFAVPVILIKRGRLLADGTRWLHPDLRDARLATVFVGSTVAMGISGHGDDGATEFGHMNHVPSGAICRCGMRGCIEAYAADYGILRTAYSLPDTTPPARTVPTDAYDGLVQRAERGDRSATHAFNLAGRALGYGIARLMALFEPTHVVIVGPGARAFGLLEPEIAAAIAGSFVARVHGAPEVRPLRDESEPIYQGLLMQGLAELDQTDFAPLAPIEARA